jgi:hypothetical protein
MTPNTLPTKLMQHKKRNREKKVLQTPATPPLKEAKRGEPRVYTGYKGKIIHVV